MERIHKKSLLYRTKVEYGDYTINHVEGCAHGCKYPCYAMLMAKRFGKVRSYEEWLQPKLVDNALELLKTEIPRLKDKIKFVHLCFTTDPFMTGYPEVSQLSLEIIHVLNSHGIRVTTLTKGIYPNEITENGFSPLNEYGITVISVNEDHRIKFEPNATSYEDRIENLRKIHVAGLKTWASIEPYPTPNISKQNLLTLLEKISFVDKIVFGRLNYNGEVTNYPYHKGFYNKCVSDVISFCKQNKIHYHIKTGTDTKSHSINK